MIYSCELEEVEWLNRWFRRFPPALQFQFNKSTSHQFTWVKTAAITDPPRGDRAWTGDLAAVGWNTEAQYKFISSIFPVCVSINFIITSIMWKLCFRGVNGAHGMSTQGHCGFQCYFIVKTSDRMNGGSCCCRIDTTLSHSVHSTHSIIHDLSEYVWKWTERWTCTMGQQEAVPGGN